MATSYDEPVHAAEWLVSEAEGTRSRDSIVIAANSGDLKAGTVLGKVTATGEYAAYADADETGLGAAVGILYAAVPDSAAAQQATIVNVDAEVVESLLTGLDANGKADLAALGFKFR